MRLLYRYEDFHLKYFCEIYLDDSICLRFFLFNYSVVFALNLFGSEMWAVKRPLNGSHECSEEMPSIIRHTFWNWICFLLQNCDLNERERKNKQIEMCWLSVRGPSASSQGLINDFADQKQKPNRRGEEKNLISALFIYRFCFITVF